MVGTISSSSGREARLGFSLRTLSAQERKRNALKTLGICWGLAVLSAPLPPIHWVTVPGFFLAGIFMAFRKLHEPVYFEELVFPCLECGREVRLPPQVKRNPLVFVCPLCRYGLKLSWQEDASQQ